MAAEKVLVQCYNKGCGKKFCAEDNIDGACQFHPGAPVFHDALKGWSCCKKRSTDFTEFLNMPGCTSGLHSNIKPPEPEKIRPDPSDKNEVVVVEAPKRKPIEKIEPQDRPSADEPKQRLKCTVGATLKQALEKKIKEMSLQEDTKLSTESTATDQVQPGTSCKNNACKTSYVDDSSNMEDCVYHPGVPIFHEGLKFWSCCTKRTTDFDVFLAQKGCTTGKHLWVKPEEKGTKRVENCRYDWHQTATHVVISMYSKVVVPDKSLIEANQVTLMVDILFEGGKSQFQKMFALHGVISPSQSSVKMLGAKVEINLKKGEPGKWPHLELLSKPQSGDSRCNNAD